MVKLCSPFVVSGVVDSSFKWPGGSAGQLLEASETDRVRQSQLRLTETARPVTGVDAPYEPVLNSCLWLYLLDTPLDFC